MIDTKLPVKSVVADSPTMLVQIEKLPEYNAADEVVQEDQAVLERDERDCGLWTVPFFI